MAYKDLDRQRQAQRDWVRQKRAEQKGSTTIIDACGKEHPIDFEGRAKDRALLESWAKGEGSTYQRSLGILAMKYSQIHGVDWPGSQEIMDADSVYCRGKTG